jgi:hypothetical protein
MTQCLDWAITDEIVSFRDAVNCQCALAYDGRRLKPYVLQLPVSMDSSLEYPAMAHGAWRYADTSNDMNTTKLSP